ncbi:hypothetical protein ACLKA6_013800 [Drosophila palustris]
MSRQLGFLGSRVQPAAHVLQQFAAGVQDEMLLDDTQLALSIIPHGHILGHIELVKDLLQRHFTIPILLRHGLKSFQTTSSNLALNSYVDLHLYIRPEQVVPVVVEQGL